MLIEFSTLKSFLGFFFPDEISDIEKIQLEYEKRKISNEPLLVEPPTKKPKTFSERQTKTEVPITRRDCAKRAREDDGEKIREEKIIKKPKSENQHSDSGKHNKSQQPPQEEEDSQPTTIKRQKVNKEDYFGIPSETIQFRGAEKAKEIMAESCFQSGSCFTSFFGVKLEEKDVSQSVVVIIRRK